MTEKLLFVTKGGEGCEEGISYVLELARAMQAGIEVLMVQSRHVSEGFEDVMAAVAFAEAGDHQMVKTIMDKEQSAARKAERETIERLKEQCREAGLAGIHSTADETVPAIAGFLNKRPEVAMVLLSPAITQGRKGFDLKKLMKTITKPVVSLTRPATAGA